MRHLGHLQSTLDDLDELGEIMTEMLQRQQSVEVCLYFIFSLELMTHCILPTDAMRGATNWAPTTFTHTGESPSAVPILPDFVQ